MSTFRYAHCSYNMKTFPLAAALFAAVTVLAVPAAATAQEANTGLTRAQVRAELVQLESVGYNPHRVTVKYPAYIAAAEAKLHASNGITRDAANSGDADTRISNSLAGS